MEDDGVLDEPEETPAGVTVAMVWARQVLGLAFMQESVLHFCEVADTAPEFRMLQNVKYELKPDTIVCPTSSDAAWLRVLGLPSLLTPNALGPDDDTEDADAATGMGGVGRAEADPSGAADGEGADDGDAEEVSRRRGDIRVVRSKNRDFHAAAAAKRLSLLRTLSDLPGSEMSEGDVLLYLEHVVPREHEQARRAISGLLSHLQRAGASPSLHVSALRRYSLDAQLYMSPEAFLSLNIFADERHP